MAEQNQNPTPDKNTGKESKKYITACLTATVIAVAASVCITAVTMKSVIGSESDNAALSAEPSSLSEASSDQRSDDPVPDVRSADGASDGDFSLAFRKGHLEDGETVFTQDQVKSAEVIMQMHDNDEYEYAVMLELDEEGTAALAEATTALAGIGNISVWVDGECVSVSAVNSPVLDGKCMISNGLSYDTAKSIADGINNAPAEAAQPEVAGDSDEIVGYEADPDPDETGAYDETVGSETDSDSDEAGASDGDSGYEGSGSEDISGDDDISVPDVEPVTSATTTTTTTTTTTPKPTTTTTTTKKTTTTTAKPTTTTKKTTTTAKPTTTTKKTTTTAKPTTTTKKTTTTAKPTTTTKKTTTTANSASFSAKANAMLKLVNAERKKAGLNPLVLDTKVCQAAEIRANEIADAGELSHTRPDGRRSFTVLTDLGISYNYCGENIANGFPDVESVMEGWMASDNHRANILNPAYTKLGVGYVENNYYPYWVQVFVQ